MAPMAFGEESFPKSPIWLTSGLSLHGDQEYLDPTSIEKNGPKPINGAQEALVLHIFGVQVCLNASSSVEPCWALWVDPAEIISALLFCRWGLQHSITASHDFLKRNIAVAALCRNGSSGSWPETTA